MRRSRTWYRGLAAKIGVPLVAILILAVAVAVASLATARSMSGHTAAIKLAGMISADVLEARHWTAAAVIQSAPAIHDQFAGTARDEMALANKHLSELENGHLAVALPPLSEAARPSLGEVTKLWYEELEPKLNAALATTSYSIATTQLDNFDTEVISLLTAQETLVGKIGTTFDADGAQLQTVQIGYLVLLGALVVPALWFVAAVVRQTRRLAATARAIADGDLTAMVAVRGNDEIAAAAAAFNQMTQALRRMVETERGVRTKLEGVFASIRDVAADVNGAASELLASSAQQTAG